MTIDEQLDKAGFVTIAERLTCNMPMDSFARHASVETLDDFVQWLEMTRRENMEIIARHDLDIQEMSDDIADFVYGKSAILWEVHVNLKHVLNNMSKENGS